MVACSVGFFNIFLFLILVPRDCVTYCQARGLSGHTSPRGECAGFFLEDSVLLEAEDDYLLLSWSDSKWAHLVHYEEIFYFELELLTSLWQALLGIHCSAMVHNCSATIHNCSATHHGGRTMSSTAQLRSHLLEQAQGGVAQWVQGARGLAVGGMALDTHNRPHGLRP